MQPYLVRNSYSTTASAELTRALGARRSRKTGSRSQRRANARGADPSIRSPPLCRLPRLRLARPRAQAASRDQPWFERHSERRSRSSKNRSALGTGASDTRNPESTATEISGGRGRDECRYQSEPERSLPAVETRPASNR
jgi:hypothetical protein